MEFASVDFGVAGIQIIVINLLLTGDHAIVIALACRNLPPNQREWGVIRGDRPLSAAGRRRRRPNRRCRGGNDDYGPGRVAEWVKAQGPWLQWAAPIAGILIVIGPAYWLKRRHSDTASNEVVP